MKRPKGNIAAYLVRNAVIALREEDSHLIFVEECLKDCTTDCLSSASSSPDPEVIL